MYFSSLSVLLSFLILLPMVAVCGVVTVKQQKPFTSQEIRKIVKDSDSDRDDDDDDDDDDDGVYRQLVSLKLTTSSSNLQLHR